MRFELLEIADGLRELRLRKQLSQHDLANASGVSDSVIHRIEIGETLPNLATLIKLSEGLDVTIHCDIELN